MQLKISIIFFDSNCIVADRDTKRVCREDTPNADATVHGFLHLPGREKPVRRVTIEACIPDEFSPVCCALTRFILIAAAMDPKAGAPREGNCRKAIFFIDSV